MFIRTIARRRRTRLGAKQSIAKTNRPRAATNIVISTNVRTNINKMKLWMTNPFSFGAKQILVLKL